MNAFLIQLFSVILLFFFKENKNIVFILCIISIIATTSVYSKNIKNWVSLILFGTLLLDYDVYFSFTEYNIRSWYLLIPFLMFSLIKELRIKKITILTIIAIIYLFILSVAKGGFLYYIKYLIYFLTMITLVKMYEKKWYRLKNIFPILMGPVYFSFIQLVLYQIFGLNSFLWDAPRPSAFFSESTWFSEYCVLIICYLFYLYRMNQIIYYNFVINIVITVMMLICAKSINGIIGLFIFLLFYWLFLAKNRLITFIILFTLLLGCYWIMQERITALDSDPSFQGRVDGFSYLLKNAINSSSLGNGFNFDYSLETIDSGAALGSKAFSLPFQIYAIGGLPLISLYLYLIFKALFSDFRKKRYISFILLIIFIVMSSFAPLAQGVVGLLFIWLWMCLRVDKPRGA